MPSNQYIIDSDTLITPKRLFYPFDMFLDFWKFIEQKIKSEEIKILDIVYDEINKGGDELSKWISAIKNIELINHVDSSFITQYSNILDYIQNSPLYRPEALKTWATATTADPWLIAVALTNSYTVVTFERSNAGLNANQPSRDAKIPDVCRRFNVKCEDLYYMMRQLGFKRTSKT